DGIRDFHVTGVQTCALPIYFDPADVELGARLVVVARLLPAQMVGNPGPGQPRIGDHPIGDDVTEVDETWHLGTLSLRERAVAPGDISPGNRNGLRFGIRLGEGPASCGPGLVAFAAVLFVSTAGDHELRTERAHEGRAFAGGHI